MPRQKKENESLNIRLDKAISMQLTEHCRETGATKTAVVEKALSMYLEDYRRKQEYLENMGRYDASDS